MSYFKRVIIEDIGGTTLDIESNNAAAVNIQDQHTEVIDLYLYIKDADFTLASDISIDDTTFLATGGHSISIGDCVYLCESGRCSQFLVTNVVTNTISIDSPADYAYTTSADCENGDINLNKDGSGGIVTAKIAPVSSVEWDIVRSLVYIQDDSAMDDGEFGGLGLVLTNGIVCRVKNTIYKNIFNVKKNGDFGIRGYDAEYTPKAPAGSFGFRFRRTFGGQDKNGVTVRLDGDNNDEFQVLVQDDLTGMEQFNVIVQGHVVTD